MYAVHDHPGIHKSELCRLLDLGWGTVSHHLHVLERGDLIWFEPDGRRVRVFPLAPCEHPLELLLGNDVDAEIIRLLCERPGQVVEGLSAALGRSNDVIRTHLRRLHDAGLLDRINDRPQTYSPRAGVLPRLRAMDFLMRVGAYVRMTGIRNAGPLLLHPRPQRVLRTVFQPIDGEDPGEHTVLDQMHDNPSVAIGPSWFWESLAEIASIGEGTVPERNPVFANASGPRQDYTSVEPQVART